MSEKETEFTREVLEGMAKCSFERLCCTCQGLPFCKKYPGSLYGRIGILASALLAEMDKPGDVWKDAPDNASFANVLFSNGPTSCGQKYYTRELPKSRTREIAEEARSRYDRGAVGAGSLDDVIESAILKALAEKEAGKC